MARMVVLDPDLLVAGLVGGDLIQCARLDREPTPQTSFHTGLEDTCRPTPAMHCCAPDTRPLGLLPCDSAVVSPLLRSFPRHSVGWVLPLAREPDYGPGLRTRSEPDASGQERRGGDRHPNTTAQSDCANHSRVGRRPCHLWGECEDDAGRAGNRRPRNRFG